MRKTDQTTGEIHRTVVAGALGAFAVAAAEGAWVLLVAEQPPGGGAAALLVVALFGLYAPLALLWALVAGALLAALPEGWRPAALADRTRAFFRGGDEGAPVRAAVVCGLALAVAACLGVSFAAGRYFFTREAAGAAALPLAGSLAGALMLAIWLRRPMAGLAARALVPLARTRLGARLARPAPAVGVVFLAAAGGVTALAGARAETVAAIPFGPLWAALGLALAPLVLRPIVRGPLRERAVLATAVLLGLGSAAATVAFAPATPRVGLALLESGALAPRVLRAAWSLADRDGDGYAAILWGGDCDDANPAVHPGAPDVPDNGIDEDCDGRDLRSTDAAKLVAGAAPPAPARRPAKPWSFLLITVDTLRWDHVSSYGYERPTTPEIDALAARGVRFERAYSQSAYTPQAVPAMLASRYPSELRRTYAHFSRYLPGNEFFAERLRKAGYRTAAVVSHFYFRRSFGLAQGFEEWDEGPIPRNDSRIDDHATGEAVTRHALRWLERSAGDRRPFLFWVHYLDPHKNYLRHPGFSTFGDRPVDLYDGEVRYTDHQIGRLLRALDRHPAAGQTVVIFTSDHGEGFGEHGYRFHGRSLYDDQIRVPLIVYHPGIAAGVRRGPVSLLDVAPTIYDFAGVEPPPDQRGISLRPFLEPGAEPPADRPILADMPPAPLTRTLRALIKGDYKLIHYVTENQFRLFNLAEDPAEKQNLVRSDRERARALIRELRAHFSVGIKVRAPIGWRQDQAPSGPPTRPTAAPSPP